MQCSQRIRRVSRMGWVAQQLWALCIMSTHTLWKSNTWFRCTPCGRPTQSMPSKLVRSISTNILFHKYHKDHTILSYKWNTWQPMSNQNYKKVTKVIEDKQHNLGQKRDRKLSRILQKCATLDKERVECRATFSEYRLKSAKEWPTNSTFNF